MKVQTRSYIAVALAAALAALAAGTSQAVTIVFEDFEGGMPSGDWQVKDLVAPGQGTWGATSYRAFAGNGSTWCCETKTNAPGPYRDNMYAWIIYGPFDLSTADSATFSFQGWLLSESSYDFLKWGYSTDGNQFWCYSDSGDSHGWSTYSINLGSEGVLGEPEVWVCVIFDTDISNVDEGAYVDDWLVEGTFAIPDDPYEENDARNKAEDFTTGENQWLSVWGGADGVQLDDDWYKITIPAGSEHVVIDATFAHANGNIDIQLVSGSGAVKAESASTTDDEQIDFTVAVAGTYYIRVYGADSGNTYDLRWYTIATLPDLTITNIQPSNPNPSTADTISVTVTVLNQGDADVASGSDVVLFKDRAGTPGVPDGGYDWNQPLGAVAIDATTTVTFSNIQWTGGDPLTWRMYATVDNSQVVAESDEGNNVYGAATVVWSVPANPDIFVFSVAPSDASPSIGELIDVTVTVENQGDAAAGSFAVGLFYNPGAAPNVGGPADQTETVSTLAAGGQTSVTFTGVTSAVTGVWGMYAVADNGGAVTESDETNNVSTATAVTWYAPELEITAVTPQPDGTPLINATISVDVTVTNNGDAAAGGFVVELFLNRAGAPSVGQSGDDNQSVASLGAGASTTVTFSSISNSVAESWSMYAIVDNGTSVLESNEGNNVAGPTAVTWRAPDLVITGVALVPPGDPEVNDTISVQVTVQNQGDAAADAFDVELFHNPPGAPSVGQGGQGTESIAPLGVGASDTATFTNVTSSVAGTWSMYAIVDNGTAVSESDETNNVHGPTAVTWRQADLVVLSITPAGPTTVGTPVSFEVVVKNQGDADAAAFEVGLYYNEPSPPSPGDTGTNGKATPAQLVAGGLAAGAQTTVTFADITSATPETWQMYAAADDKAAPGDAAESDETNNVTGTSVVWTSAGEPDLVILSVTPDNAGPTIGTAISVDVVVENQGDAGAGSFQVGLFENPGAAPSVGASADHTETVSSLGALSQTIVTFTGVTNSTVETWSMYVVADNKAPAGEVAESNESNNVHGPTSVSWYAPDLVITAVTPVPGPDPVLGDSISVQVTIENQGGAGAGEFAVELFKNPPGAPSVGNTGDATETVGSLGSGASTTVTFLNVSSAAAETWGMYAVVDNGSTVLESNEGNNVHGPTAVTWKAPDLVITGVALVPPGDPEVDDVISVEVTVENTGDADAVPFVVELFHNEAEAPSVGLPGQGTESVMSLLATASTTVTFAGVQCAVAETWSMYVIVDNAGAVTESDETNNVDGPTAVTWRQADLVITAITPSNSSPTEGNTITVDVTVENQGNADAGQFDVGLFYNEAAAPAPGGLANQTQNVTSLAAGISTTLTFTGVTSATAGMWEMYAIADNKTSPDDVAESDETNNVGGPTTVVWAVAPKPDLRVTAITPIGAPDAGGSITVQVDVSNQGAADAGSFRVDFFENRATAPGVGETNDPYKTVSTLASGNTTSVSFTVSSAVPADWQMWAIVDTVQVIDEELEGNNVFGPEPLTWTGVDLEITAVTPSSADNLINTGITVDVTVTNNGNAASGAFFVGLFYDCSPPPSVGDGADQEQNDSLGAGASTTITFAGVSSSVPGTWSTYAIVDNDVPDLVDEYDESNNVSGPAVSVTWRAPDLRIVSVTPSNSNPSTAETIDVTVVVENQGDADAGAFDVGLLYNSPSVPVPGASADETQTVAAGLAAGLQTTITFTGIGNAVSETWSMYAIADNGLTVDEGTGGGEDNNVSLEATVVWGVAEPDLEITGIAALPGADPAIGDQITVSVTVRNRGAADAGQFNVALFFDRSSAPAPGDAGADRTEIVNSLLVGKSTTVEFTDVTSAVVDAWQMYAVADNGLGLGEEDETNNVGGPFAVTWHAPELAVTSVEVKLGGVPNYDPTVGELVDVEVTIANNGDAPAANFTVALFYDSATAPAVGAAPDEFQTVVSLAESPATTVLTFTGITYYEAAAWSMYAIVDNGEVVLESDEANNVHGPTAVTWHGPDLVVDSVVPSDPNPSPGASIDVTVTVRNQGDLDAAACTVALFNDRSTPPSIGDTPSDQQAVGALTAGGTDTVVFTVTNAAEAEWQTWAYVDKLNDVTETDEANNSGGPASITWGFPETMDLVVVSVGALPDADPDAPGSIDIEVVISNGGTGAATFFNVGLYYDLDSPPEVGSTPDRTMQVASLAGGASHTLTFTGVTNDVDDLWQTYVLVDSGGAVNETDETNNASGPVTVTWGDPRDLVITDLVVLPDADPAIADTVTVRATVLNQGEAASGACVVGLYLGKPAEPAPGSGADVTASVGVLAGGASTTVEFAGVGASAPGVWSMYAVADDGLAVDESDEGNNVSGPLTVSWHAPELEITSIVASPNPNPLVGDVITVTVTVWNYGDIPADDFTVALFYDEASPPAVGAAANESQPVVTLAAGGTTTVTFPGVTSSAGGTWDMYAVVDNGAAVVEADEGNNAYGPSTVTWSGPDLTIVSIVPATDTPSTGQEIDVVVTVSNDGDRTCGNFVVALFLNRATPPSAAEPPDRTDAITTLGGGGSTAEVTFQNVVAASEGVWQMWAMVDRIDEVNEQDETNNVSGPVTVTWDSPDLRIVSIAPATDTPVSGEQIDVVVTVENLGNRDAAGYEVALFYNEDQPPAVKDIPDPGEPKTVAGPTVSGGQEQVTFQVTNPAVESWQMYAIVDNGEVIHELDETNNVAGPVTVQWQEQPGITVTSPDGGERLESGTVHLVTWESTDLDGSAEVLIKYSLDGGLTWEEAGRAAAGDGQFAWAVPDVESTQEDCFVRITAPDAPTSPSDESNESFTTVPKGASAPLLVGEGCVAGRGDRAFASALLLALAAVGTVWRTARNRDRQDGQGRRTASC